MSQFYLDCMVKIIIQIKILYIISEEIHHVYNNKTKADC